MGLAIILSSFLLKCGGITNEKKELNKSELS